MIEYGLFDGSFVGQNSLSLGGENSGKHPVYMRWLRNVHMPVSFYTDIRLHEAMDAPREEKKFAILVEPPALSDTHYLFILKHPGLFKGVFTFDVKYINQNTANDLFYYPFGGSWIPPDKWRFAPKRKLCSIIGTDKFGSDGHKMRHEAITILNDFPVSVFGKGYNPVESKVEALADFRFSVVIENCRIPGYFSEKLIDCFSQGTIPIYWGCPDIGNFFDERGIIKFTSVHELPFLFNDLSGLKYDSMGEYVESNYYEAYNYRCAEDNIFTRYERLING